MTQVQFFFCFHMNLSNLKWYLKSVSMSFEKVLKLHSIGHLSDLGDTLKFGFQPNPRPFRAIIFKNVSNTEVLTKGEKNSRKIGFNESENQQ